jgi:hypothetical protein
MRTSEVLARIANEPGDRLTVESIFAILGDRSFSLLIVILGLPNCIPMPPPIPLLCALLLIVVAIQIAVGRNTPWMPRYVLARSIAQSDVRRAAARAMPYLTRLEHWSRPRLQWFRKELAPILIGSLVLLLALGLLTAAPFLGQIPWGLAVCLVGLGLVEHDGLLIVAAIVFGAIGASISAGFIYAIFVAISNLF